MTKVKVLAGLLGGALACSIFALAVAFLGPLLHGGQAVSSRLSWLVPVGGFLATALFSAYLATRSFSGKSREIVPAGVGPAPPRFWAGLLAIFLGLTAAIGITGYFYVRYQAAQQLEAARETLSSVADLKANEISNWYQDRETNARAIFTSRFIQEWVAQFLEAPPSASFEEDLVELISGHEELGYRRIVLFDAKGTVRLSWPSGLPVPEASNCPGFQDALAGKGMAVIDLSRNEDLGRDGKGDISLGFRIPIKGRPGGEARMAGVLLLEIDPYTRLFPLIQTWPTDSRTAETLLVRREGSEVVYLNELRHRKNTALTLRFPMDANLGLPATRAVKGEVGIVEGKDYRGLPVLAALRGIPGTPWFMVSKIDLEEINAPVRRQLLTTTIVLLILILASAFGVALLGRRRDNEWLRQQLAVEQERQVLAERVLLLNKHASDIILMTDKAGRIMEANDRALAAYGYSPEEIRSLAMEDLREPGSGAAGEDGVLSEFTHRRRDGTRFPVESNTHSMEIGGATYRLSVIRDITERKRAEQELRSTRDYLEKLLDHANAPIIVWDPELRITRFNHAFERLTGEAADRVVGRHLGTLFPEDTRNNSLAEIARALGGEHWESVEIPVLRNDGSVRIALWNSANLYDEDGKTLVATIAQGQDITDRKKAAHALEQANEELARKNQELEQIVYVASHDLRSPLVNVQGFSTELKAALEELRAILDGLALPGETRRRLDMLLAEDLQESLGFILSGISKMDTLISGLLRLSRLGRAALSMGPVDMNRLAAEVARTFEFQVQEAGVDLSIGDLPPCIGDAGQLNQAFSNLIGNALKYLDPARPGVIRLTGALRDGQSVYCVEDNGIGIAARHHAVIFNLYHRLDPGASPGEGLGLTIVRTVLERQHGKIWLESEAGAGARFYVALPHAGET